MILQQIRQYYCNPSMSPIDKLFVGLMDILLEEISNLPSSYYCKQLWNSLKTDNIPEQDRNQIKGLITASLLYQVYIYIFILLDLNSILHRLFLLQ